MTIRLGKIIRERSRFLWRIYGRLTVAVCTTLYVALSLYSWAASEFASTRVQRDLTLGNHIPQWSGWTWGAVGLVLALALGLEGAFRQVGDVKYSSERKLADQREKYEEQLRAVQEAEASERSAHGDTRRALEKAQTQPVSRDHRDRMIELARTLNSRIGGDLDCKYWSKDLRPNDARKMIAAHFPTEMEIFDKWDSNVTDCNNCVSDLCNKINADIKETMSAAPWQAEAIAGAFDRYLVNWMQVIGSGTPEPAPNLTVEDGRVIWHLPFTGSQILGYAICDTGGDATLHRAAFEEWFARISTGYEFDRLRAAYLVIRGIKVDTQEAAWRIMQRDEIYGRCPICEHP